MQISTFVTLFISTIMATKNYFGFNAEYTYGNPLERFPTFLIDKCT